MAAAPEERLLEPGQRPMGGVGLGVEKVEVAVAFLDDVANVNPNGEDDVSGPRSKASGVASFIGSNRAQIPYSALSRNVPSSISAEIRAPVRTKTFCGMLAVPRAATVTASART
jgi:hypothetical protein